MRNKKGKERGQGCVGWFCILSNNIQWILYNLGNTEGNAPTRYESKICKMLPDARHSFWEPCFRILLILCLITDVSKSFCPSYKLVLRTSANLYFRLHRGRQEGSWFLLMCLPLMAQGPHPLFIFLLLSPSHLLLAVYSVKNTAMLVTLNRTLVCWHYERPRPHSMAVITHCCWHSCFLAPWTVGHPIVSGTFNDSGEPRL